MLVHQMPDEKFPEWMDKTGLHTVGIVTLDDGERMTAEVVGFDEESWELIVDVISSNRPHPKSKQEGRAIPVSSVVSFEPQPSAAQPWPHSDPCRHSSFSLARFALMATLFLSWTLGSLPLFFLLQKEPYGFQVTSAIVYTIFEAWFTFAATRSWSRFLFTCPAVQPQFPPLLLRHLGFLVALVALQTAALAAYPHLPDWWHVESRKGMTPFAAALLFSCMGLAFVQVFTNRRLLERAHREFS